MSSPLQPSPRPPPLIRPVGGNNIRYQNGPRGGPNSPQPHSRHPDNPNKSYGNYHSKNPTNTNYRGQPLNDGSKSKSHIIHPNGYPEPQSIHRTPQQSPRPPNMSSPTVHHAPHPHQQPQHFHPQSPLQMHQPHPSPLQTHIRPPYPQSPISMNMASPIMNSGPVIHGSFTSPQQRGREKPGLSPAQIPLTPPIPHVTLSPSMSPMSMGIPPGTPVQTWGAPYYPYQYAGYPAQFDPSTQQAFYRPVYPMPYGIIPHMPGGIPQQRVPSSSNVFVAPQPKQSKAVKIVNPETGGVVNISKKSPSIEHLPITEKPVEKKDRDPKSLDSDAEFFSVPQKKISKAIPIVNPATKSHNSDDHDEKEDVKSIVQELEIKEDIITPVSENQSAIVDVMNTDEISKQSIKDTETSIDLEIKPEESVLEEKSVSNEVPSILKTQPDDHEPNIVQETQQSSGDIVTSIEEDKATMDANDITPTTTLPVESSHKNDEINGNFEESKPHIQTVDSVECSVEQEPEPSVELEKTLVTNLDSRPEPSDEKLDSIPDPIEEAEKPIVNESDNVDEEISIEDEPKETLEEKNVVSNKSDVTLPVPSVLNHEQMNHVSYPPNIQAPSSVRETGKLQYDRSFLLQFWEVCKEKPVSMPSLESLGIEE
ncbi:hypothetical protein K7432_015301, partial [Basidiobolus ranarum]